MRLFRSHAVSVAAVLGSISFFLYVQLSTTDIIFQTQFVNLFLLERWEEGEIGFGGLFTRFGEHGMLGYNLLFILNARLFRLTSFFDYYLSAFFIIVSAIVILKFYLDKFSASHSVFFYAALITLAVVLFSPAQKFGSGMDIQVRGGLASQIIFVYWLSAKLGAREVTLLDYIVAGLATLCCFFIFGTFYGLAWYPAFFLIIYLGFKFSSVPKFWSFLALCLIASFGLYVIVYGIIEIFATSESSLADDISFSKLLLSLLFYVGGAVLSGLPLEAGLVGSSGFLLISVAVLVFLGFLVVQRVRDHRLIEDIFPISLITYSIFVGLLVAIGRASEGDWTWMVNEWYHIHANKLCAGLCLLGFATIRDAPNPQRKGIVSACIWMIVVAVLLGAKLEVEKAPHIKAWLESKYAVLADPSLATVNQSGVTELAVSSSELVRGSAILEKYKLNIHSPGRHFFSDVGDSLDTARLEAGWFAPEGGGRWIGKRATALLDVSSEATITITGFVVEVNSPVDVRAQCGSLESNFIIGPGSFRIEIPCGESGVRRLKLTVGKTFVPKEQGGSDDVRALGVFVTSVSSGGQLEM